LINLNNHYFVSIDYAKQILKKELTFKNLKINLINFILHLYQLDFLT
jgi:hypothetical protein